MKSFYCAFIVPSALSNNDNRAMLRSLSFEPNWWKVNSYKDALSDLLDRMGRGIQFESRSNLLHRGCRRIEYA